MASAINRGTKRAPNFYAKIRDPETGRWTREKAVHPETGERPRLQSEAEHVAELMQAAVNKRHAEGKPDPRKALPIGELAKLWKATLANRNADEDKRNWDKHVGPRFDAKKPADVRVSTLLDWIDEMRAEKKPDGTPAYAPATMRRNLNLLSRFFSWAVERGHVEVNPVRNVPQGKRPVGKKRNDTPWIDADTKVREAMHALAEPFRTMFYLANRAGMRPGEVWGLRMSDLAFLDDGVIRVRYSYDGPLKEDKQGTGDKIKWVPAPTDAAEALADTLALRRAGGAQPEDLVFPGSARNRKALTKALDRAWAEARDVAGLGEMTWYQATRHSFATRNLAAGASLDEVADAMGHSSPLVTRAHYDHHIRRSFSAGLRQGLGIKPADGPGKVLAFPGAQDTNAPTGGPAEAPVVQNLVQTADRSS